MTTFDLDAHLAECRARMTEFTDRLLVPSIARFDEVVNTDGVTVRVAEIVRSGGGVTAVVLTDDGEWADTVHWHGRDAQDGPTGDDDWVRYERYTAKGMVAHGFVHRRTRRLLQTG